MEKVDFFIKQCNFGAFLINSLDFHISEVKYRQIFRPLALRFFLIDQADVRFWLFRPFQPIWGWILSHSHENLPIQALFIHSLSFLSISLFLTFIRYLDLFLSVFLFRTFLSLFLSHFLSVFLFPTKEPSFTLFIFFFHQSPLSPISPQGTTIPPPVKADCPQAVFRQFGFWFSVVRKFRFRFFGSSVFGFQLSRNFVFGFWQFGLRKFGSCQFSFFVFVFGSSVFGSRFSAVRFSVFGCWCATFHLHFFQRNLFLFFFIAWLSLWKELFMNPLKLSSKVIFLFQHSLNNFAYSDGYEEGLWKILWGSKKLAKFLFRFQ